MPFNALKALLTMPLLQRLRQCVSDDRELEPILSYASGGGARILSRGRVEFQLPNPENSVYAAVKFKRGRITEITPGPALMSRSAQDTLVQRATNEAAHVHGTITATRVLFSERKLSGHYAWKDRFRINPCPTNVPIGTGLNWVAQAHMDNWGEAPDGPPYPFILHVHVPDSPNPLLRSSRTMRELDTYQNLLTLLISGYIRTLDGLGGRVWALC